MAPATFHRNTPPVQPYYVSPWQDEPRQQPFPAPVLKALRGDFFCLPFGGNNVPVSGESHPPHGEIAGMEWKSAGLQRSDTITSLTLTAETQVRPGKITKTLLLKNGHNVIYSTHLISGFVGAPRWDTTPLSPCPTNPAAFASPPAPSNLA